jgi:predicted aldo/keto reductase-like oxidoreductase
MIYKQFKDKKLSYLGMGNMRLPRIEGQGEKIEDAKARTLIEYAYQNGVNYFDTAYRYHGGESETFVGEVLEQFPRDSFYLATKMPGHMMEYKDGVYKFTGLLANREPRSPTQVFEEQLERCRVGYFDFYLLHNVCETAWDFYTSEEIGVVDYLLKQKQAGRIRHLGLSAHGRADTIDKFLTKYNCFEFVQIQLNYLDWTLQNAGKKYEVITKHGLPVITMESCRGGRLVSLNPEADAMLKAARPYDSIVSWAFRFLQSLPNVPVVLSGMTTLEQLKENIELFSREDPATDQEKELLQQAVKTIVDMVPCTGCFYCTEACPQKLDIPGLFSTYNEMRFNAASSAKKSFTVKGMTEKELPSACIACGACVKLCPQGIDIPSVLKQFSDRLE